MDLRPQGKKNFPRWQRPGSLPRRTEGHPEMKKLRPLVFWVFLPLALSVFAGDVAPQATELRGDHLEMWSTGPETRAICTGSVTLTGTNLRILCDRLEIIAEGVGDKTATIPMLEKFKYLLATGHVHIVQGDREATCG